MKIFDKTLESIEQGRSGRNVGLPYGIPSLVPYIPNIQKKTYYLLGGESGCLGIDTKVIMADGTMKLVQDVVVGDSLMGIDSKPRKVLKLYRGEQMMYNIKQIKGITYRVNESHILSLTTSGARGIRKYGDIVNISVKDYLNLGPTDKRYLKGYRQEGIDFDYQEVPIDPYLLGVWLGDGTSKKPQITNTDPEVIDYILEYAKKTHQKIRKEKISYSIVRPLKRINQYDLQKNLIKEWDSPTIASSELGVHATNISLAAKKKTMCHNSYWEYIKENTPCFNELLQKANLKGNKHIPQEYLYNSREVRLKLLAGITDTDGYCGPHRTFFEVIQKSKTLAYDIAYLARSLGFSVSFKEKNATMRRKDGTLYECLVYRMNIYGGIDKIPNIVARRKGLPSNLPTNHLVTGFDVIPDKVDKYYGFELDGDHLFLLEDFTVTHNSGKTSLTDYMFLYSPFDYLMEKKRLGETKEKLKILYWSLEIDIASKITKGICQRIWKTKGILVDPNYILSRGKNKISQEIFQLVMETREYFDEMHDILEIHDVGINATGITKRTEAFCKENFNSKQIAEFEWEWTPKDEDLYLMCITDHIGLTRAQKGLENKKAVIDYVSGYNVEYRNKYSLIPVDISQFNRSIAAAERELSTKAKPNYDKIKPQLSDFKDSAATQENCNVAMTLFNPNRYGIPEYMGYNTSVMGDRARFVDVVKSREGTPDLSKALGYIGEAGVFVDLPVPSLMDTRNSKGLTVYEQLLKPKKII